MPEQIRCPSCDATLRVPDTLLGKNVKCPKCQTTFTAATDAAEEEAEERVAREPAPAARRRPAPPPEDDDDEGPPPDDYEEDEDRPRRRKRGRRSAMAESAVAGPAIALMVVGGIDLLAAVLNFLSPLLGFSLLALGQGKGGGGGAVANLGANMAVAVIQGLFLLLFGVLIIVGAVRMKQLRSPGLAMTACIMAMIPCVNCCLLGLPFGIWGLVVLNKPEVKRAFS